MTNGRVWGAVEASAAHLMLPENGFPSYFEGMPSRSGLPTSDEAFGSEFIPDCIGRQPQLQKIKQHVRTINRMPTQKSAALFFQASPGMGKTFLLRMLIDKNNDDQIAYLVVDFSRGSCDDIKDIVSSIELMKNYKSLIPLLRLFYIQFIDQKRMPWLDFFQYASDLVRDGTLSASQMVMDMKGFIMKQYEGKRAVVVLVDELAKSSVLWPEAPDDFRRAICRWADGSDRLCHTAVFSSLEVSLMEKERLSTGRPMIPVVCLPLFTLDESVAYLTANTTCAFELQSGVEFDRDAAIRVLAAAGGGHPRSLLYICNRCSDPENKSEISDIIADAGREICGSNLYLSSWTRLLFAAILAQPVRLNEVVTNDSGSIQMTYEQLVRKGIILASLETVDDTFIPIVPELYLHAFCKDIRDLLASVLDGRCGLSAKLYESLHGNWERLVRLLRRKQWEQSPSRSRLHGDSSDRADGCGKMTLSAWYRAETTRNGKSALFQMPFDCTTPLEVRKYVHGAQLELQPHSIYYPHPPATEAEAEVQAGWDALIVLRVFPQSIFTFDNTKYLLPCFIRSKWSRENEDENEYGGAMPVLAKFMVDKCVANCQLFLKEFAVAPFGYSLLPQSRWSFSLFGKDKNACEPQFVVIFGTNSEHTRGAIDAVAATAASNVLSLPREHLLSVYGPMQYNCMKTLLPDTKIYAVESK